MERDTAAFTGTKKPQDGGAQLNSTDCTEAAGKLNYIATRIYGEVVYCICWHAIIGLSFFCSMVIRKARHSGNAYSACAKCRIVTFQRSSSLPSVEDDGLPNGSLSFANGNGTVEYSFHYFSEVLIHSKEMHHQMLYLFPAARPLHHYKLPAHCK